MKAITNQQELHDELKRILLVNDGQLLAAIRVYFGGVTDVGEKAEISMDASFLEIWLEGEHDTDMFNVVKAFFGFAKSFPDEKPEEAFGYIQLFARTIFQIERAIGSYRENAPGAKAAEEDFRARRSDPAEHYVFLYIAREFESENTFNPKVEIWLAVERFAARLKQIFLARKAELLAACDEYGNVGDKASLGIGWSFDEELKHHFESDSDISNITSNYFVLTYKLLEKKPAQAEKYTELFVEIFREIGQAVDNYRENVAGAKEAERLTGELAFEHRDFIQIGSLFGSWKFHTQFAARLRERETEAEIVVSDKDSLAARLKQIFLARKEELTIAGNEYFGEAVDIPARRKIDNQSMAFFRTLAGDESQRWPDIHNVTGRYFDFTKSFLDKKPAEAEKHVGLFVDVFMDIIQAVDSYRENVAGAAAEETRCRKARLARDITSAADPVLEHYHFVGIAKMFNSEGFHPKLKQAMRVELSWLARLNQLELSLPVPRIMQL